MKVYWTSFTLSEEDGCGLCSAHTQLGLTVCPGRQSIGGCTVSIGIIIYVNSIYFSYSQLIRTIFLI